MSNKKTITLTRKIEIFVSETDTEIRKSYYNELRQWHYLSRQFANKVMSSLQSGDIIDNNLKSEGFTNTKERSKEFKKRVGCVKSSLGYSFAKKEYRNSLPTSIKSSINRSVRSEYSSQKVDILKGERTNTSYKKGYPTSFTSNFIDSLSSCADGKNFTFNFKTVKLTIPMSTRLGRDKSDNNTILTRIVSGEYKLCDSAYIFDGKKMFLLLTYKQPVANTKLDDNKVVGVDLGINTPAYVSINSEPKKRMAIGNRESFINNRLSIQKQKRSLQKSLKFVNGGRGVAKKMKKLDSFKQKERNFVKTYNHTVTKTIIDFAVKNKCGVINIEDLSGISKGERDGFILRNWSYFELQSMLKYKANKYGIKINIIDPRYTSQRCSKCGNIHKDNRVKQDKFLCTSCGFEDNADYNASQNISIAHTDEFIEEIKIFRNKKVEKLGT